MEDRARGGAMRARTIAGIGVAGVIALLIATSILTSVIASPRVPQPKQPLITNHVKCDVLVGYRQNNVNVPSFVCSPQGRWLEESNAVTAAYASTRPLVWGPLAAGEAQEGCCPPGKCWMGDECFVNQTRVSKYRSSTTDYTIEKPDAKTNHWRCIDSVWTEPVLKTTPDNSLLGFCPESDPNPATVGEPGEVRRCLFKPSSGTDTGTKNMDLPESGYDPATMPACIRAEQWIGDNFCGTDGNWTSRTKILALNMMRIAANLNRPYSLFCDKADVIFDDKTPLSKQGLTGKPGKCRSVESGKEIPCYNNFCMLRSGPLTVIGTSLNTPLENEDPKLSFANVMGRSSSACSGADGKTFQSCVGGVYYNRNFSLVLYVPGNAGLSFGELASLDAAVLSLKQMIISKASDIPTEGRETTHDFAFFGRRNSMGVLYAAENGGRKLFGFIEEDVASAPGEERASNDKRDFVGVRYAGGDFNICSFINERDSTAVCKKEAVNGAQEVIIGQQRTIGGTETTLIAAWRDLTAKLRP